jgi:hypothetical protein
MTVSFVIQLPSRNCTRSGRPSAVEDRRSRRIRLTGDGVAAADAGEHFPEGIENAVDGKHGERGVTVGDVLKRFLDR